MANLTVAECKQFLERYNALQVQIDEAYAKAVPNPSDRDDPQDPIVFGSPTFDDEVKFVNKPTEKGWRWTVTVGDNIVHAKSKRRALEKILIQMKGTLAHWLKEAGNS